MALAMSTHACRPELHCRFRLLTAVDSGNPAARAAARNSVAPPPGARTEPTAMSSTKAGSIRERVTRQVRVCTRRSAAAVSFSRPLPPRVKGVRRQAVTTMSSGDLERMYSRPEGMSDSEVERFETLFDEVPEERWEESWERRAWAGK